MTPERIDHMLAANSDVQIEIEPYPTRSIDVAASGQRPHTRDFNDFQFF